MKKLTALQAIQLTKYFKELLIDTVDQSGGDGTDHELSRSGVDHVIIDGSRYKLKIGLEYDPVTMEIAGRGHIRVFVKCALDFLSNWHFDRSLLVDLSQAMTDEEVVSAIYAMAEERGRDKGYGDEGIGTIYEEIMEGITKKCGVTIEN